MKADFTVRTPSRTYPLYVRGSFPTAEFTRLVDGLSPDKLFLVIDENAGKYHGPEIRRAAGGKIPDERVFTVPAGEKSKSYGHWKQLVDFFLEGQARRNSLVLAAGGGVTGDLAGFAASSALRGLPLVHLPTTLLAMVDSSIGGKTGINHDAGKNLIGSFYQPDAIFISTGSLATLPDREWMNGLSEILKYAAIREPSVFRTCRDLFSEGRPSHDDPKLVELIRTCARIKASVVGADERESGLRMILNFGHTFAHALERLGGYGTISHGEAVYVGMIAAAGLSAARGASLDDSLLKSFRPLYDINPEVFTWDIDELIGAMGHDKKRSSENLKLVLLHDWGQPYVSEVEEVAAIRQAWQYSFHFFAE